MLADSNNMTITKRISIKVEFDCDLQSISASMEASIHQKAAGWQALMQSRKLLFHHKPIWAAGSTPAKRVEPPDDSAGRFAQLLLECEGRCPQRAGIASPHAAGDGLSGVATDGELRGVMGVPA